MTEKENQREPDRKINVKTGFSIDRDLLKTAQRAAKKSSITFSRFIRISLERELERIDLNNQFQALIADAIQHNIKEDDLSAFIQLKKEEAATAYYKKKGEAC